MWDFRDERPLQLLRPVYVGSDNAVRLARGEEVAQLAQERERQLRLYCQEHSARMSLRDSEDHWQEAENRFTRALKDARERIKFLHQKMHNRHQFPHQLLAAAQQEAALVEKMAVELGLQSVVGTLECELTQLALRLIDPIVAIAEPAWRLPDHRDDVLLLRTIVHWDDNGVTLLH